ncbi:hypothetical protein CAY53_04195 [Desulfobulbus oralis]|uniref:Uncharacterized protein n=1 Tax=Desulfobulbus oralis TaxID=1986146 RepID=A0A2L1GM71_9BACT|nr:hypothetical protein CAY53_04195 [Desulfobulbus oralis]
MDFRSEVGQRPGLRPAPLGGYALGGHDLRGDEAIFRTSVEQGEILGKHNVADIVLARNGQKARQTALRGQGVQVLDLPDLGLRNKQPQLVGAEEHSAMFC